MLGGYPMESLLFSPTHSLHFCLPVRQSLLMFSWCASRQVLCTYKLMGFCVQTCCYKTFHRCWLRVRHFETPLTQTQTVGFWTWTWRKLCEFSLDSEYWNLSFCRNARKSLAQACRLGLFNCRKPNGVKQIAVIWLFHHCIISAKILKLHVLKIVLIRFLMFSFFSHLCLIIVNFAWS